MKYELIKKEKSKEVIMYEMENEVEIMKRLLYELWLTKITNVKFRKVRYNYNYKDLQTIEFIDKREKESYIYKFSDIPTKCGILDTDRILKRD